MSSNRKATIKTEAYESFGKTRYRLTLECGHVTTACNKLKSVSCGECSA